MHVASLAVDCLLLSFDRLSPKRGGLKQRGGLSIVRCSVRSLAFLLVCVLNT